jgi:2-oxoglutarate dehydrogenase E1 component
MTQTIKNHPRPYEVYARQLIGEGLITEAQVAQMEERANARMSEARATVAALVEQNNDVGDLPQPPERNRSAVSTAVTSDLLRRLNEELLTVPEGFTVHPKLLPQLERRREAMGEDGGILWAHAEALAIASLLVDGVPVRLTGQDTERGTFSQRHLQLHDAAEEGWMPFTGRTHTPMRGLQDAKASFEVFNSPLSEAATIGFEYGYSTLAPETLVMWEAQYGDFANGGQIMVDQFIASGRAKWGERSRLVMLLPHGYEGNGPEHSSARIERFLQACAEDNMRVANPSTADSYFHLLRRQGLLGELRPLIVFTPKSLLRSKDASCRLDDLVNGEFQKIIEDPRAADRRESVTRLLLCSGKIYYDLDAAEARATATDVAIARLELLYPLPEDRLKELFASYPNLSEVTWVQEEPRNMGAWTFVPRRLERILPQRVTLYYVGRSARSSPAEGYPQTHRVEQQRIVNEAFSAGADRVIP